MRKRTHLLLAGLLLALLSVPAPALALEGWQPTAPMAHQHSYGQTARLNDGRVLVIGANDSQGTEIYDPAADRWAAAGAIENGWGALLALPDGGALVSGGRPLLSPHGLFASAMRFDPAAGWQTIAPMGRARAGHTLSSLPGGRVLAAGGIDQIAATGIRTSSTEIYDPASNTWSPGPPMAAARAGHTATRLADGRLLVVGGDEAGASAEIYDPASNAWQPAAPPPRPRPEHTATWLPNNTVLVVGGGSAEIYDPAGNAWRAAGPMLTPRSRATHIAALLPSGQVLVAGGSVQEGDSLRILAAAERYDWTLNRWLPAAPLREPREGAVAAALPNFELLVAGGYSDAGQGPLPGAANGAHLLSAERYRELRAPERCFAETGLCVRGPFMSYWLSHGGLAINGYPLSPEFTEVLEDGNAYVVQYFERVRMEHHPNLAPPYDILLGQFGRRMHPADPPAAPLAGARYFADTGHNVRGRFLRYWLRNGGLPQFGYPLSEEFAETLEDGNSYTVQYFERARFEHHPENRPPYDVLLGQFGRAVLGSATMK